MTPDAKRGSGARGAGAEGRARILVIGSESHGRSVFARAWHQLPPDLNVADFDAVVLDFTPFGDVEYAERVRPGSLPSPQAFAHLLFGAQRPVFAIGDPRVTISAGWSEPAQSSQPDVPRSPSVRETFATASYWLPMSPRVEALSGRNIQGVDEQWEFWFSHVQHYDWCFDDQLNVGAIPISQYLGRAVPGATGDLQYGVKALASTSFAKPVAAIFWFLASGKTNGTAMGAHWLPPCTEVSAHEAVELLLRSVLRIRDERARPAWIDGFTLPAQDEAASERARRASAFRAAEKDLREAVEAESDASRAQGLLYETGDVLEGLVWEALRALGATVVEPTVAGIDDGRVVDPKGRQGMLEIKGISGPVGLGHVRQLTGWMQDAQAEDEWEGKGLLIVNPRNTEPLGQRSDLVADNANRFAVKQGVCIATTSQVFEALRQHQHGSLDREAFWDSLFLGAGLSQLPEPTAS